MKNFFKQKWRINPICGYTAFSCVVQYRLETRPWCCPIYLQVGDIFCTEKDARNFYNDVSKVINL
jgi:hypothetical protein